MSPKQQSRSAKPGRAQSAPPKAAPAQAEANGEPEKRVPRSQISGYRRSKEKGIQMIGVSLPVAYLRIIDTERQLMGSSRNHFMSQIVLRKVGLLPLERPRHAPPVYDVTDDELRAYKAWTWYLKPEIKQHLDKDMLQLGKRNYGDWITSSVNDWIGKPRGLRS
jgi:hypothetical protein